MQVSSLDEYCDLNCKRSLNWMDTWGFWFTIDLYFNICECVSWDINFNRRWYWKKWSNSQLIILYKLWKWLHRIKMGSLNGFTSETRLWLFDSNYNLALKEYVKKAGGNSAAENFLQKILRGIFYAENLPLKFLRR